MRHEFFQVLPALFSMVIVALFGASLTMITIAIGIVSWTTVARITLWFLRIRELEYVMASELQRIKYKINVWDYLTKCIAADNCTVCVNGWIGDFI